MITTRQYLKFFSKDKDGRIKLHKLFKIAKDNNEINELDYWLLTYAYAEGRMVDNTCNKLAMCKKNYHIYLNQALIKIGYTLANINLYTL